MPPTIIVRSAPLGNPEWVAEMIGKNYGRNGPQLAGRRVRVTMPMDNSRFNPWEHVQDLGRYDPRKPQVILPGFGYADAEELKDIAERLREKNDERGGFEPEHVTINWNDRVARYADMLARRAVGRKTFGPTGGNRNA